MKVKGYLAVLTVISTCFVSYGYCQSINLPEAIDIALKDNPQILMTQEKVRETEQAMKEAFAGYFPLLSLQGNYTHLGEPPKVHIPDWGDLEIGAQDTTAFSLSLTQPLYTGGQLSLANQQAKLNYQVARENLKSTQSEITFQVKQSFYSIILAQENLQITKQALGQAEAHLQITESFYQSGRASRFDLLRAKVEVAKFKPEVIRAKNDLALAKESLAILLSQPSSLEIEGKLKFEPGLLSLDEALQAALVCRSDLKSLRLQEDMVSLSIRITRAANLPFLSLLGNYEYTASGGREWENDWNVNLVLGFTLFDAGKNKAQVEQRRSQVRQMQLAIKQLREGIQLEVKQAFWNIQAAKESIVAQEQSIQQAEEALSIAEARYKSGTITQVEVLDAQFALTSARLGYTGALYDYNLSRANLNKAMGRIQS